MKVATWNLERKKPTSLRGAEAVDFLHAQQADVAVIVEARITFPARGGFMLFGEPTPADRYDEDERKICMWSATPLERVDVAAEFGSPIDPTRFLAARTTTDVGDVLFLAICIPWHMAEVTVDGRKAKPWQRHIEYLTHLDLVFGRIDEPLIVAGDFNQRVPRQRGSKAAAEALANTFARLDIVTAGVLDGCDTHGIDHIALSRDFWVTAVGGWKSNATGNRMSDHDGAWVEVSG